MKHSTTFIMAALAMFGIFHVASAYGLHLSKREAAAIIEHQNRITLEIEDLRCRMDEIQKGSTYMFVTPCKYHRP